MPDGHILEDPQRHDGQEGSDDARRRFNSRREFASYAWFRIVQTRRYWLLPVLFLIVCGSLLLNVFTGYNVLPAVYSLIP